MQDMEPAEIGSILRHPAMGRVVQDCVHSFPSLSLEAQLQPITRSATMNWSLVQRSYKYTCTLVSKTGTDIQCTYQYIQYTYN